MRSEAEMFELILNTAREDERIRAVLLSGSRANPDAPQDSFQDFDIVYIVADPSEFWEDTAWLGRFGERLLLQMPESMRDPMGDGHMCFLTLFADGRRMDLSLMSPAMLAASGESATVVLLDKDGTLPSFPGDDSDWRVQPPMENDYRSCCNNFWWCLQNVAKGVQRGELPFALAELSGVRDELKCMLSWLSGARNGWRVSVGKAGKYLRRYLTEAEYKAYLASWPHAEAADIWRAVDALCGLFPAAARTVAQLCGADGTRDLTYDESEGDAMRFYLSHVRHAAPDAAALIPGR